MKFPILHKQDFSKREVQALYSEDKAEVIRAVNAILKMPRGSHEQSLIDIVDAWEEENGYAPLWAMVLLGRIGTIESIPHLLLALDSDADIFNEACEDALTQLVQTFGEDALTMIEDFIEVRMDNDPNSARLFAYGPIARLTKSERAKRFIFSSFEKDDTWKAPLANYIADIGDVRALPLLRRMIEFAVRAHDQMLETECRYAYCILDGAEFIKNSELRNKKESWQKPWEDRWDFVLNSWLGEKTGNGKENEAGGEYEDEGEDDSAKHPLLDEDFLQKIRKENTLRDNYPLKRFDIRDYLAVHGPTNEESSFASALRLLGASHLSVETVQEWIYDADRPGEVIRRLQKEISSNVNEKSLTELLTYFQGLWNTTPHRELGGLTPDEMVQIEEVREENEYVYKRMSQLADTSLKRKKIGRNDPCPCKSGKKYKKCCGK